MSERGGGFPYTLVDVFSTGDLTGNPLAVVHDADALSEPNMQQIARYMNLSETVFLRRPTHSLAHYSARIFALDRELPWAGHPTLGACHAWAERRTFEAPAEIIQQSQSGLSRVRRIDDALAFAAPRLRCRERLPEAEIRDILALVGSDADGFIQAMRIDNGPGWIGLLFDKVETILSLKPRRLWPAHLHIGVIGLSDEAASIEARAFHTDQFRNVVEDPVTGSFAAAAAQWLIADGRLPPAYTILQGRCIGRAGRIGVATHNGEIWISGTTRSVIRGTAFL